MKNHWIKRCVQTFGSYCILRRDQASVLKQKNMIWKNRVGSKVEGRKSNIFQNVGLEKTMTKEKNISKKLDLGWMNWNGECCVSWRKDWKKKMKQEPSCGWNEGRWERTRNTWSVKLRWESLQVFDTSIKRLSQDMKVKVMTSGTPMTSLYGLHAMHWPVSLCTKTHFKQFAELQFLTGDQKKHTSKCRIDINAHI